MSERIFAKTIKNDKGYQGQIVVYSGNSKYTRTLPILRLTKKDALEDADVEVKRSKEINKGF